MYVCIFFLHFLSNIMNCPNSLLYEHNYMVNPSIPTTMLSRRRTPPIIEGETQSFNGAPLMGVGAMGDSFRRRILASGGKLRRQ